MDAEKNMVEEYISGMKTILSLEEWKINLCWKGKNDITGVMAVYDYHNKQISLSISENLLDNENGVHELFQSITNKITKAVTGEVIDAMQHLENRLQKIIYNVAIKPQTVSRD